MTNGEGRRVIGDLTAMAGNAKKAKISAVQIPINDLDRERIGDTHTTWSLPLRTKRFHLFACRDWRSCTTLRILDMSSNWYRRLAAGALAFTVSKTCHNIAKLSSQEGSTMEWRLAD